MSKVRVYEVARQLSMDQKALVALFQSLGFVEVRNHMSAVDSDAIDRVKRHLEKQKSPSVVEERIRPTVVKRKAVARPSSPGLTPEPRAPQSAPSRSMHTHPLPASVRKPQMPPATHPAPTPLKPVERMPHPRPMPTRESAPMQPEPTMQPRHTPPAPTPTQDIDEPSRVETVSLVPDTVESLRFDDVAEESLDQGQEEAAAPDDELELATPPSEPAPTTQESVESQEAAAEAYVEETFEPEPPVETAPQPVEPTEPSEAPPPTSETYAESPASAQPESAPPSAPPVEQEPVSTTSPEPVSVPLASASAPTKDKGTQVERALNLERAPESGRTPVAREKHERREPHVRSSSAKETKSALSTPASAPAPRAPTTPPRTGIETWAGRPGVPMPPPPAQPARPPAAPIPRRVQYDPRAAAAQTGKTDPRAQAGAARKPQWGKGKRNQPGPQPLKRGAAPSTKEMSEHKKVIKIEEKISLQTLASRMSLKATEVLMKLLSIGMPGVNINSTLDADTAKLLASEFGWDVEDVSVSEEEALGLARGTDEVVVTGDPTVRPPIVTVMGHVDHGKTSLLDQIRKTNVAANEAGGITQHIGAYRVSTPRGPVAFLDTPGHAAFTQMRARGAQVTDIVVLVVAADDGVMPQTREAISHARAAKVPVIVAVNKIDKPGAQPDRVRRELAELELVPEEWGGETIFCDVSAKTRQGIESLLEMILLQAELLDLSANATRPATGHVLEALLDRGRGPVARVMVVDGTLRTGDVIIAGATWGKIRAMTDDRGRMVAEAGPATPVEILGLSEVPNAGDPVHAVKDPKKAQEIALGRKSKATKSLIPASAKVSLEDLATRMAEAGTLELRLIIKADVQGSVEAVADALAQLSTEKVKVAIIHAGVGGITEGDVNLAVASKAIIVGFNVRPAGKASSLAESEGVEIRIYNIIYNAVDDIKRAMVGMLGPTMVEKIVGKAEIRQTFHIAKIGSVGGAMVLEGTIKRSAKVRLIRDAIQVWEGRVSTVKRFKDDVKEVEKGFECGLSFDGYNDFKVGDIVECYEVEEIAATL